MVIEFDWGYEEEEAEKFDLDSYTIHPVSAKDIELVPMDLDRHMDANDENLWLHGNTKITEMIPVGEYSENVYIICRASNMSFIPGYQAVKIESLDDFRILQEKGGHELIVNMIKKEIIIYDSYLE